MKILISVYVYRCICLCMCMKVCIDKLLTQIGPLNKNFCPPPPTPKKNQLYSHETDG